MKNLSAFVVYKTILAAAILVGLYLQWCCPRVPSRLWCPAAGVRTHFWLAARAEGARGSWSVPAPGNFPGSVAGKQGGRYSCTYCTYADFGWFASHAMGGWGWRVTWLHLVHRPSNYISEIIMVQTLTNGILGGIKVHSALANHGRKVWFELIANSQRLAASLRAAVERIGSVMEGAFSVAW